MIETIFISVFVGAYMFYGQLLVDYVQATFSLEPSSYLYTFIGIAVIIFATLVGKAISRGLK